MVTFDTLDELKNLVEENGGIVTTTMECLRDACNAGRLGKHVRQKIHNELAGKGLGHLPEDIPESQHEQIHVFKFGTSIGQAIDAIRRPSQSTAEVLRSLLGEGDDDAKTKLQKIRAVLED
jgi:hypothetical protein